MTSSAWAMTSRSLVSSTLGSCATGGTPPAAKPARVTNAATDCHRVRYIALPSAEVLVSGKESPAAHKSCSIVAAENGHLKEEAGPLRLRGAGFQPAGEKRQVTNLPHEVGFQPAGEKRQVTNLPHEVGVRREDFLKKNRIARKSAARRRSLADRGKGTIISPVAARARCSLASGAVPHATSGASDSRSRICRVRLPACGPDG